MKEKEGENGGGEKKDPLRRRSVDTSPGSPGEAEVESRKAEGGRRRSEVGRRKVESNGERGMGNGGVGSELNREEKICFANDGQSMVPGEESDEDQGRED